MSDEQHRSDWLTVEAAAKRLGVSPATVKRRIHDGRPVRLAGDRSVALDAELLERPQGHEWRVRIRGALPPLTSGQAALSSDQERSDQESAAPSSSDPAPLTVALDTINRLVAEQIGLTDSVRRLEREAGTLRAERDAARQLAEETARRLAQAEAELAREMRRSWLDRLLGRSPD